MDIGVVADTLHGVSLVTAPSIRTKQGYRDAKITWIRFDPRRLLQWLDSADVYLRAPVRENKVDGTRWAPRLMDATDSSSWLTVGRDIREHQLRDKPVRVLVQQMIFWR